MKTLFVILFCSFPIFFYCEKSKQPVSYSVEFLLQLKKDFMNIAILIVDFESYTFEGGCLQFYPLCKSTDNKVLPFNVTLISPGDFGSILFSHKETNDTIFYATIIWAGRGKVIFPKKIISSNFFQYIKKSINKPSSIEYFDKLHILDEITFKSKADSAWNSIANLDIVQKFAAGNYRIGLFLYPPTVGVFDTKSAKWIIFLYRFDV